MSSEQVVPRGAVLAVVIPYFQRTPGLLAQCVRSVLSQVSPFDVRVVVTDDESPVPAEPELRAAFGDNQRITLVKQKNAGPGAARNSCLDHLPPSTEFVALLDSDDAWLPGFLDCAARALRDDVDLFFADSQRFGQELSRFNWHDDESLNLRGAPHAVVDRELGIYRFTGDFFDFLIRRSNILSSSSMIYRLNAAPDLRFDTTLFNGQDRLFKLRLGWRARAAVFSTRVYCREGEGVNIFDSAVWGSRKAQRLCASYISLHTMILQEFELNPAQRRYVRRQLSSLREQFLRNSLHLLRSGDGVDWPLVRETYRRDWTLAACAPLDMARALVRKSARALQ